MAAAAILDIEEFNRLYAHEHGYEYWFGKVVRKPLPTALHSFLQALLCQIFYEVGYLSGPEVDIRISREFQPRPDVMAALKLDDFSYPRKPFDIVAEVLSPNDPDDRTLEKCEHYADLGIEQIYVFDPEARKAFEWNRNTKGLDDIEQLVLTNGKVVRVADIFGRLEERLRRQQS